MVKIYGSPKTVGARRRTRYLMLTLNGIRFVEKWYTAEHIPSDLTRLYRLLLRLIWMKGTMTATLAQRLGYGKDVLQLAISGNYVKIDNQPSRPLSAVQNKIDEMIGEAPRCIYA